MSIRSYLEARGVNYDSLSSNTKFYVFIGWLVDMGVITTKDFHEYFGQRNNIPECCIAFFIENYDNAPYAISLSYGQPPGLGYAMCPECIKGHHEERKD